MTLAIQSFEAADVPTVLVSHQVGRRIRLLRLLLGCTQPSSARLLSFPVLGVEQMLTPSLLWPANRVVRLDLSPRFALMTRPGERLALLTDFPTSGATFKVGVWFEYID